MNTVNVIHAALDGMLHNLLIKRLHVIELEKKSIRERTVCLICLWFSQQTSATLLFLFFFCWIFSWINFPFCTFQGENIDFYHLKKKKNKNKSDKNIWTGSIFTTISWSKGLLSTWLLESWCKNAITMEPMNLSDSSMRSSRMFFDRQQTVNCVSALLVVGKHF